MADPKSSSRSATTEDEIATHCAGVHRARAHPLRVAGFVDGNGEVSTFAGRRATADGDVVGQADGAVITDVRAP